MLRGPVLSLLSFSFLLTTLVLTWEAKGHDPSVAFREESSLVSPASGNLLGTFGIPWLTAAALDFCSVVTGVVPSCLCLHSLLKGKSSHQIKTLFYFSVTSGSLTVSAMTLFQRRSQSEVLGARTTTYVSQVHNSTHDFYF